MEHNLKGVTDYLLSNGGIEHEPLVDGEGFPRSDIDVYEVAHMRNKRACLITDLKEL